MNNGSETWTFARRMGDVLLATEEAWRLLGSQDQCHIILLSLGMLHLAVSWDFGVVGFSWDIYFCFPTSLGKKLMCGGHISVRTKAVGNRHKAKLLGSQETQARWTGSSLRAFLYTGMKEDQIRFLLLVKKYRPQFNLPWDVKYREKKKSLETLACGLELSENKLPLIPLILHPARL